jgi:hypothetical protein
MKRLRRPDRELWRGSSSSYWLVAIAKPVSFGIGVLMLVGGAGGVIVGIVTPNGKLVVEGVGQLFLASLLLTMTLS